MCMRVVLASVLAATIGLSPVLAAVAKDCSQTAVSADIQMAAYTPSESHLRRGDRLASQIKARLRNGVRDARGAIVVLVCGNGIGRQIGPALAAALTPYARPQVHFAQVAGVQAGILEWADPFSKAYVKVHDYLRNHNLSPLQVQVAICPLTQDTPNHTTNIEALQQFSQTLSALFPNMRVVLYLDQPYQGYFVPTFDGAHPNDNVVREGRLMEAIADAGELRRQPGLPSSIWAEFVTLYAQGPHANPYAAGLAYACTDLAPDGRRLSAAGINMLVANLAGRLRSHPVLGAWLF